MKKLIKMQTSKKITWVFILFYILQVIATAFIQVKYSKDLIPLLNYTTPLVTIILISYFGKSTGENLIKIKQEANSVLSTMGQNENI